MMSFAKLSVLCSFLLSILSSTAYCQEQENEKAKALKTLEDAADHFCTVPSLDQTGEELELSGDAKAALNGVIAKAVGLGVSGAAKYNTQKSKGVLQKDLASAIEKGNDCKLEVLRTLKEYFFPSAQRDTYSAPQMNVEVAQPSEKSVGWLRYSISTCQSQGDGVVRCDGTLRNADASDHGLIAFVAQRGGIRNMAFAHFGIAAAYDSKGGTYEATRMTIANQASGETGQFQVNMLSGLRTPFSIYFGGVATDAKLFYRIRIPIAVRNNSFQLSADKIAINE